MSPTFCRRIMKHLVLYLRTIRWVFFLALLGCDRGENVLSIAFNQNNPDIIYVGAAGGNLYKSRDGGLSFEKMDKGLTTFNIASVGLSRSLSTVIYAGTYGDSVYRSINSGRDWVLVNNGLDDNVGTQAVNSVIVAHDNIKRVYIGTNHGVYETSDGGSEWTQANMGMANRFVISLTFDPMSNEKILAGTNEGIYLTTNGARQWRIIHSDTREWAVNAIRFDRSSPGTIYAGTNKGVFKTVDGGKHWEKKNVGLSSPFVSSLVIDSKQVGVLYAGNGDGVYQSVDAADSWQFLAHSPNSVSTLASHPIAHKTVLAGTMNGLYKSTDQGRHWAKLKIK